MLKALRERDKTWNETLKEYCARDTTRKRDSRKEILHDKNAAGERDKAWDETLKEEAALGNQ